MIAQFHAEMLRKTQKGRLSINAKYEVLQELTWLMKLLEEGFREEEKKVYMSLGPEIYTETIIPSCTNSVSILVGADTFVEMSCPEALLFLATRQADTLSKVEKEKGDLADLEEKLKVVAHTMERLQNLS